MSLLLTGDRKQRAEKWVQSISEGLFQKFFSRPLLEQNPPEGLTSLFLNANHGSSALLGHYLAKASIESPLAAAPNLFAQWSHNLILENRIPLSQFWSGLFTGITGMQWLREHLSPATPEQLQDSDRAAESEVFDARLEDELHRSPWEMPFDLISGYAGIGLYALDMLSQDRRRSLLEKLVDCLEECAIVQKDGCAWFTPATFVPINQRELAPHGYFNLGMAHGVPGVIVFLARTHRAGILPERTAELLERSVSWMLSQRIPSSPTGTFPGWIVEGSPPQPTQVAWCYGDLGVAAALFHAARSLDRSDWEGIALAHAENVALRFLDTGGVVDASLCHGAAGNAHIFNRLYRATHNERFADAARHWVDVLFSVPAHGERSAEFQFQVYDGAGSFRWEARSEFLVGNAGVALALLSMIRDIEPNWDRCLALS